MGSFVKEEKIEKSRFSQKPMLLGHVKFQSYEPSSTRKDGRAPNCE